MALREELMNIYNSYGGLTPELVVTVASDPSHPLHSRFEWDDQVAGDAYRKQQARALIRTVRIRYVSENREQVSEPVRAFTTVRGPSGYAYEPTLEVVSDPLKVRMVLADMRREWQFMKARYEAYAQFWDLVRTDLPGVDQGLADEPLAS